MSTPPFTRKLLPVAAALAAVGLVAAACGGDGDGNGDDGEDSGPVLTPVSASYVPQTVSSDLAVGSNRFMVGLIDQEQQSVVIGADLHFDFFKIDGEDFTPAGETDAESIEVTKSFSHIHEDGTQHKHEAGDLGVYAADVEFDSAGEWAVEVSGTVEGEQIEPVRALFSVKEQPLTIAVGEPAPRTTQLTIEDVDDITDIDTSDPPNPAMHDMTIADAVTSGRPTVIAFATPAFCQSQICGPTKEVVDELYEDYQDEVNFVHVEPYDVTRARSGDCPSLVECLVPAIEDWRLQSEPWVFLVDAEGNIAAKFEAVVTHDELQSALVPLLNRAGASEAGY